MMKARQPARREHVQIPTGRPAPTPPPQLLEEDDTTEELTR